MNHLHVPHRTTLLQRQSRARQFGKLLTIALLTCVLHFGLAHRVNAQCPPGYILATTTMVVTINCGVTRMPYTLSITYCIPGPTIFPPHAFVQAITPMPAPIPAPCEIDGTTMREIGRKLVEMHSGCDKFMGSCPNVIPIYNVSWMSCLKYDTLTSTYLSCGSGTIGWCLDQYFVCCSCSGVRTFYAGSNPTNRDCEPGCIVVCPPAQPAEPVVCN